MPIGDLVRVEGVRDLYCLDAGLYGTPAYGAIYVFDTPRPTVVETSTGRNHGLLLTALGEIGIDRSDLRNIVLTHIHLDHAGGAGVLAADCPEAEVFVHEIGAPFLTEPDQLVEGTKREVGDLWEFHVEPIPIPNERITPLSGGDTIELGNRALDVIHVPGHATHQVALYDGRGDALFTADEAGAWLPEHELLAATTPPSTFDLERNQTNLERLEELAPATLLYTHFGPRPAGSALEDYLRLLTEWVADIEAKREVFDDEAVIEHFVSTAELSAALGYPAGTEPTRMFVRGVMQYLDRHHRFDQ
jgi:glyoxylase-like metal-dependent hydrolase (beta-lactamase superfamily II)